MVEVERGDLTRKYKIGGNANMANLKDVKVIDMEDGNVTKIEYDGKEYEKVSEGTSPKKGDIGLRVTVKFPDIIDATEGNYYEINMGTGDYENYGEVGYVDDEGHASYTTDETNFVYFRENSDSSEMTKDGLSVGDTVILDAGDAADEYPLHGFYNGGEYKVTDLYPDHGMEGRVRIKNEDAVSSYLDFGYALPSQLRKKGDFKEGDRVRINIPEGKTPEYHWGAASNGDVGTVVEVCEHKVVVNFPKQSYWNALPSELEMITEEDAESDVELGDLIRVTDCKRFYGEGDSPTEGYSGWGEGGQGLVAIGSIGKVKSVSPNGVRVEFSRNTTKTKSRKEDVQLTDFFLRHGEFEVVEEYPGDTAEVGDKVYVTDAWITTVEYYDGDVFTVSGILAEDAFRVEEHVGVVATKEVVVVEKADKPKEDAATDELESLIGKYVVFSDRAFQSDLITGKYYEITEICDVDKDGFYVVDETGFSQFVYQDASKSNFIYEIHDDKPHIEVGDLVEVVDSPMAQPEGTRFVVKKVEESGEKAIVTDGRGFIYCAKKHVKLIEKADGGGKSERETGEIRLGDIVRVDDNFVSSHDVGDIGIVSEYENNGNFRVETPTLDHANWVGSEYVTLLAKVEDRVDDHEYA